LSAEKESLAEQKAQVVSIRQSLAAEKQKIEKGRRKKQSYWRLLVVKSEHTKTY
jgi:hypothetical protein